MGFRVLAADEGIFVGRDDGHTVTFGTLTVALEAQGILGRRQRRFSIRTDLDAVEIIHQHADRPSKGPAGWGLVDEALAGPFGDVISGWLIGKTEMVVAAVRMKDGTKFLGQFTKGQLRMLSRVKRLTAAAKRYESLRDAKPIVFETCALAAISADGRPTIH
ncbi:MAG: hypothetical protein AAFQ54_13495 [Pseudomonadota bacterium]